MSQVGLQNQMKERKNRILEENKYIEEEHVQCYIIKDIYI